MKSPDEMKQDCPDKSDCFKMLQSIIDEDATPQEKEHFKAHIEECMPCFQHYHLDMAIRDLLKLKCTQQAPPDLIERIRTKIGESTIR